MPKIIIEVMPKEVLLDPAGKSVLNALHRKAQSAAKESEITAVRIGKRIELHFDRAITDSDLAEAHEIGEGFLSNGVIEDVVKISSEN